MLPDSEHTRVVLVELAIVVLVEVEELILLERAQFVRGAIDGGVLKTGVADGGGFRPKLPAK